MTRLSRALAASSRGFEFGSQHSVDTATCNSSSKGSKAVFWPLGHLPSHAHNLRQTDMHTLIKNKINLYIKKMNC